VADIEWGGKPYTLSKRLIDDGRKMLLLSGGPGSIPVIYKIPGIEVYIKYLLALFAGSGSIPVLQPPPSRPPVLSPPRLMPRPAPCRERARALGAGLPAGRRPSVRLWLSIMACCLILCTPPPHGDVGVWHC
jgi:hypothetical protein